jgi:two-component system chemotaxis response regulator CheY
MSYKVLVVDDSRAMRMLVMRSLRSAGLEIENSTEASNGVEATKVLGAEKVDIVFSDWNMPEMNGLELLKWVRANAATARVPFYLITTETGDAQVSEALKAGANGYLCKPFAPEDLSKTLTEYLT